MATFTHSALKGLILRAATSSGSYIPRRHDFVVSIVDNWAKERGKEGAPALQAIVKYILDGAVLVSEKEWDLAHQKDPQKFDEVQTRKILEDCLDAVDEFRDIADISPDEVAEVVDPIFTEVQRKARCPWPFHRC
ncbi:hypothetical protein J7E96_23245 [Streptomyces sp. ISL-96]|uniref:hypothetical protein n=1 Tax=Streptomyces sp. ISL-96 TaxID=2819191 RepID=UPI001BE7C65A|nr:hypothetical protein [Streptomyces sp. ISL-96]MBT2491385.1 hypothetical protein [Streptomyces sp. ISL-96]